MRHALQGIMTAVVLESNIRRQLLAFILVVGIVWLLQLNVWQWLIIVSVAILVLAAELINSSLEALADGLHPDYNECIQRTKDMAAGAVLLVSFMALLVGVVIIGPPLWRFIEEVSGGLLNSNLSTLF